MTQTDTQLNPVMQVLALAKEMEAREAKLGLRILNARINELAAEQELADAIEDARVFAHRTDPDSRDHLEGYDPHCAACIAMSGRHD